MRLDEIVEFLRGEGVACRLVGHTDADLTAVNTLEDAGPTDISFLANPRYRRLLATTRAGLVVLGEHEDIPDGLTCLCTPDPYLAITLLIQRLHGERRHPQWGLDPRAAVSRHAVIGRNPNIGPNVFIADDVIIGDDVTIYPGVAIMDGCRIGNQVTLMPNVVLYENTIIGDRVTIHAGTVIGEDGLGYAPADGKWVKIPQVGHVEIGDDVEIGANCTIDRATLGRSVIGAGTKFSNLIAIGHGTKVGEDCLFVAQVGLAGSVSVGRNVTMAGQVGVVGHVTIGDGAVLGAKAGVTNDVPAGATVLGAPAVEIHEAKRQFAALQKLPEMRRIVARMRRRIADLERQLDEMRHALEEREGEGALAPALPKKERRLAWLIPWSRKSA